VSLAEEEKAREKKLSAFLTWIDLAIRDGRKAGLSDDYLVLGLRNRLGKAAGQEPAAVEAGRKPRDYGEWKAQKAGSLLSGRPPWTVDKDGNPAERPAPPGFEPSAGPHAGVGEELAAWVQRLKRFSQCRRAGRIPHAEYESALPQGSAAWRKLVVKWGAETAPDEGQGVGQFFPGDPRGVA
jgi:hypothetical protein